jgi:ornithine cyclodeaminase/alanine dehydrogenase-like protein (mu-crystallin family)
MEQNCILFISRDEIELMDIGSSEIMEWVEDAFREKYFRKVEIPPKPGIHPSSTTFIHAMPAYVQKFNAAGIKWISGSALNPLKGLPYLAGLIILNDPETGLPISVMDASWITAKRTAAVTAISAKYLARKDSETLSIIGCGVQGKSHLEFISLVLAGLKRVKIYDTVAEKVLEYERFVKTNFGLEVFKSQSPREAVQDSDLIVTATPIYKNPSPVGRIEWVKDGSLLAPLEFDSYWSPETFYKVDKLFTDDIEQLKYYRTIGHFPLLKNVDGELCELVVGKVEGRVNDSEKILALNLGLAITDIVVAKKVYEKALAKGLGVLLKY